MLTELCAEIHNYFCKPEDIKHDTFTIVNGAINLPFLQNGQYFRIVGSVFNDGVWQYGVDTLTDEDTFDGCIWAMSVPPAVLALSTEIDDWIANNLSALNSPYQSESFGGYSYSIASGNNGTSGGNNKLDWQTHFASRLRPYRKLREI